jgi:putative ABC transport system permease protein
MNLALPLRMLGRDWRAGELRILAVALVIAVASVTSVAFFADRVRQALLREAHQLLGADVVLSSDHPWRSEIRDEIARRGLRLAETTTFISMARLGGESHLAGVKAVTDGYPLRGNLRTAPGPNVPDARAEGVPRRARSGSTSGSHPRSGRRSATASSSARPSSRLARS